MRGPHDVKLTPDKPLLSAYRILVAGRLLTAEPVTVADRLTPDRLAYVVAALEDSPSAPVRPGAHQLRHLIRAGQAQVYVRVLLGLPVARASLDLFPPPSLGR